MVEPHEVFSSERDRAALDAWVERELAKAPPMSEEVARRVSAILFAALDRARRDGDTR